MWSSIANILCICIQLSVSESVPSGTLSEGLLTCLGRLESHMTTCGGLYLLEDAPCMADVLVWATLYVATAPEATTAKREWFNNNNNNVLLLFYFFNYYFIIIIIIIFCNS